MHIVDYLALWQQDDQILGDEADSFLFHLLGNPDAGILGHAELSTDDTDICAVEIAGTSYVVWITCGDSYLRQVRGKLLGIGIHLLDHSCRGQLPFKLHIHTFILPYYSSAAVEFRCRKAEPFP